MHLSAAAEMTPSGVPPMPSRMSAPLSLMAVVRAAAREVARGGRPVAFGLHKHDVGIVAIDPGAATPAWPQPLATAADFCFAPTWSPDGALVAWHEWNVPAMPWDDSRIALRGAKA